MALLFEEESYQILGACFEVYNYLMATGLRVGLLVNFGAYPRLEHDRIIR